MTKEIVGGAGVRLSRMEFRRWQHHANVIQKKEDDCQSFDFLVTPSFILEGIPSSHLEITMHLADTSFDNHIGSKTPHLLKIGGDSRKTI